MIRNVFLTLVCLLGFLVPTKADAQFFRVRYHRSGCILLQQIGGPGVGSLPAVAASDPATLAALTAINQQQAQMVALLTQQLTRPPQTDPALMALIQTLAAAQDRMTAAIQAGHTADQLLTQQLISGQQQLLMALQNNRPVPLPVQPPAPIIVTPPTPVPSQPIVVVPRGDQGGAIQVLPSAGGALQTVPLPGNQLQVIPPAGQALQAVPQPGGGLLLIPGGPSTNTPSPGPGGTIIIPGTGGTLPGTPGAGNPMDKLPSTGGVLPGTSFYKTVYIPHQTPRK